MEAKKQPRCYNCKHAGQQFKIKKLTHLHCEEPIKYNRKSFDNDEFCAWDTLRVFSDTCEVHEFKAVANIMNKDEKISNEQCVVHGDLRSCIHCGNKKAFEIWTELEYNDGSDEPTTCNHLIKVEFVKCLKCGEQM